MDDEFMRKAIESMQWNASSEIPIASEENRLILEEIRVLRETREETVEFQHQTEERLRKLHEHSKNAEVTINHNLKLLIAYQSDVRTETHLCKIAGREHSKLKQDLKNMEKEWNNFKSYIDKTEKEMCTGKRNIDNLTNRIKWAKTALIDWRQAMEDGNKGLKLIEMYYKDDQMRASQQNLKRQKLNAETDRCRKKLVEMYNEQKTLECNLECTSNLYRTAHAERRQMVETWKMAAAQMTQREKDIRNGEIALLDYKQRAQKSAKKLKENVDMLNAQIANNRKVEEAIEQLNEETSDLKENLQILIDSIILKKNEVELLQKELQNLASRVEQQRADNRRANKFKEDNITDLNNTMKLIVKLEERLNVMSNKNMSAQQRLEALEELMDTEDKAMNAINKETDRINGLIYRSQEQLAKFREDRTTCSVNVRGILSNIEGVLRGIQVVEKNLKTQTESNYELSFKILQFERRILQMQGVNLDFEEEQRNKTYLVELEDRLSKLQKDVLVTQLQNKNLDDDMRKLTITYNNDMKQLDVVNYKIKEAQSYCEGGVKRIKDETKRNQELIVELSILKMRTNEFEEEISKCEESAYNLAKHRMHLNRTIKDRMIEIQSQINVLNLKRKHLLEEMSTLKADIGERKKYIEAAKSRFELTSKLLGVNEDGSLITATQLKVETAQEKQMLLDEGNELNEAVIKAEREIRGLENTLAILNNCNASFRKQMRNVQVGEEADEELKQLHLNYCTTLNTLRCLRLELQALELKTQDGLKKKKELDIIFTQENKKRCENSESLRKLQKDLQDQENKLIRADRELKTAIKALKQRAISDEFLSLFERDLDLKEIETRNLNVINQLGEMSYTDYDLGPKIARIILDRGLKLPHMIQRSGTSLSWRSQTSFDMLSFTSSRDLLTQRSSTSEMSEIKEQTSSARLSVVSLEWPEKKKKH